MKAPSGRSPTSRSGEQPRPIFLSGVYRSGTTFLTAVINNLPNVVAASSTVKYLRFCFRQYEDISTGEALVSLLEQVRARLRTRWSMELDVDAVRDAIRERPRSHAVVYDEIMNQLLLEGGSGATRWGEKLAMQWWDIPAFLRMFPGGQVIHIFRDPRDTTASYKRMTWEDWPTFLDAALNCKAAMMDVPRLQAEWGRDRIHILRAEDLAADLPSAMRDTCDFLGEPFDPSLADLSQFEDIKGEDWRSNSSFDPGGANYAEAARRWEEHLTQEELFLIELICQPQMAEFGYEGSGADVSGLDPEALGALLGDNWFAGRLGVYLRTGRPEQGYRTDPYTTEMEIVFGDTSRED